MQRPLDKANKQRPFLGNGSVNTFPLQRIRTQHYKNGVFYVVRAEKLCSRQLEQRLIKFIRKMLKQLQPLHCYTQLFAAHPKYVQKKCKKKTVETNM
jgi:hypothetical protein